MKGQYILGINGWGLHSHDASATLIKCNNNKIEIIAAAEEERFTRKLHAYDSLPINAVKFCLEQAKISPEELSFVASSWNIPVHYKKRHFDLNFNEKNFLEVIFNRKIKKIPKFEFVNHHYAHALSAFGPSGFESANILIIDGQGETESTSLWSANKNSIRLLNNSKINSSIGYFYESLTEFIGFRNNQPGKTMGLSPYGNPEIFFEKLQKYFSVYNGKIILNSDLKLDYNIHSNPISPISFDEQEQLRKFWFEIFSKTTGLDPNDKNKVYSFRNFPETYLNLASSGQKLLEEIILQIVSNTAKNTLENNLCLAGGVALNCVTNGRIMNELGINIYVQPAANDAGTSLGAALAIAKNEGYDIYNIKMTPYLGKEYTNDEVYSVLKKSGLKFKEETNMYKLLKDEIAKGKVIGLFQGRFEFGPRALGNRSFIANPNNYEMFNHINKNIKAREEGRPLAATILSENTNSFFGKNVYGPHMTINHSMTSELLNAVRHVDNSIRPQILSFEDNILFYEQIKEIGKTIGVNAIINTSLNFKEPIINSPDEALALFKKTAVDMIIFNNNYVAYRG